MALWIVAGLVGASRHMEGSEPDSKVYVSCFGLSGIALEWEIKRIGVPAGEG